MREYVLSKYIAYDVFPCATVCPELSNPEFGSVTLTGRTIGSNATYTCDSGYALEGSTTRVCERLDVNSAGWSADAPTCQRTYACVKLSHILSKNLSNTISGTDAGFLKRGLYAGQGLRTTRLCGDRG